MNDYAVCMPYYEGETFPYLGLIPYLDCKNEDSPFHYPCTKTRYEYWQPEGLNDEEFNLVILLHGFPVRVRGCHFDFVKGGV